MLVIHPMGSWPLPELLSSWQFCLAFFVAAVRPGIFPSIDRNYCASFIFFWIAVNHDAEPKFERAEVWHLLAIRIDFLCRSSSMDTGQCTDGAFDTFLVRRTACACTAISWQHACAVAMDTIR